MVNILIVDDNQYSRIACKLLINDQLPDLNVLLAKEETEALQIINEIQDIAVVVTDLVMQSVDGGMKVLMAAKEKDPFVMVIILTAFGEYLNLDTANKYGAFDYLQKLKERGPGKDISTELIFRIKNACKQRDLTKNLIESQKKMSVLERFFDKKVFKRIEKNPELLLPINRTVSIVFWDVRGFSSLSEILKEKPNLISGFLTEYFESASKIIFQNNGVLDKFIGDGVMALFGAFDENYSDNEYGEKDAIDAVKAALELKTEFQTILLKWQKKWSLMTADTIDIGLGCGIHSGEALVGNLGTFLRDHFTAVGAHVNLASRIEGTAQKNQIRISGTTRARVDGLFSLRKVETLENIKNIRGSFDVFEVLNIKESN